MNHARDMSELHALARDKLVKVFGAERGEKLLSELLSELRIAAIRTPDDLAAAGEALKSRGQFEAAIGGLLAVQAAMRKSRAV